MIQTIALFTPRWRRRKNSTWRVRAAAGAFVIVIPFFVCLYRIYVDVRSAGAFAQTSSYGSPAAPSESARPKSKRSLRLQNNPRIVLVVAHYSEWDRGGVPDWANATIHRGPTVASPTDYAVQPLYQRRYPAEPRYVPNNAFEAGVYVRYIVDHYDTLPDVVVFSQADAAAVDMDQVMGAQLTVELVRDVAGGFLPINCGRIMGRDFSIWSKGRGGLGRRVEECWRQVASEFGRDDVFEGVPYSTKGFIDHAEGSDRPGFRINMMCCACYAVTKERIREAASLDGWRDFYHRAIVNGSCVPGRQDVNNGKDETGGAFEHLAHVILGRKDALWQPVCVWQLARKRLKMLQ